MNDASPQAMDSHPLIYESIGSVYRTYRRPDPRIAAQINAAIGDARRICNVGAGSGSYEPSDRAVVAVEPSRTMCAQRDSGAVRAVAEALPFVDDSFDAVTAFLTVHHWERLEDGVAELRRIAPRRVVLTFDNKLHESFWLVRDYLPEIGVLDTRAPSIERLSELLGGTVRVETVWVPRDCTDGFLCAYWRRPEAYLDPNVRACMSGIAQLHQPTVERGIAKLRDDLDSGAWAAKNGELAARERMDFGYRLIVSDA